MSDVMMFGIAKMPYEMAMGDEISRRQYYSNTQRLIAALEAAQEQLDWAVRENDRLLAEGSELTARTERLAEALEFRSALTKTLLPYQDEAVASRAEIKALRVDVEAWKTSHSLLTVTCHHFQARAKQLEEALLGAYGQVRELCDCYGHAYPEASFARYEALLRPEREVLNKERTMTNYMKRTDEMYLVYKDEEGNIYYQHWADVQDVGTLVDPETGEDLELVGWATPD